ncbi:hypothetical protein Gotur_021519 [Gossypium turneri]
MRGSLFMLNKPMRTSTE